MPPAPLHPLEPGQRTVMRLAALFPAAVLALAGLAGGVAAAARIGTIGWSIALVAVALALWIGLVAPARRWAAWGWALEPDELHVAHGVWTRVRTVVPLDRVQHIDLAQGPLERANGVARLILHTAGTTHAVVVLPGLSRATAEHLRDTVRAHIRAESW